jgi:hypothetical protein
MAASLVFGDAPLTDLFRIPYFVSAGGTLSIGGQRHKGKPRDGVSVAGRLASFAAFALHM